MIKLEKIGESNIPHKNFSRKAKDALKETSNLKCAYCETKFSDMNFLNIEHLIPKSIHTNNYNLFRNYNDDYDSLVCVCHSCNMSKGTRFPISSNQEPLILNPYFDNPEEHFHYDYSGIILSNTEKGNTTINTFNLNRSSLLAERRVDFLEFRNKWKYYSGNLLELELVTDKNSQFAGMKRYFSRMWRKSNWSSIRYKASDKPSIPKKEFNPSLHLNRLKKVAKINKIKQNQTSKKYMYQIKVPKSALELSIDNTYEEVKRDFQELQNKYEQYDLRVKNEQSRNYYTKNRIIERVKIKNFKGIGYLDILLPGYQDEKAPWFMLLGENGTGKSSILKAISIVLMGAEKRRDLALKGSDFVKVGEEEGYISVYLSGTLEPITINFKKSAEQFYGKGAEAVKVLLLAYGSTRILSYEDNIDLGDKFTLKIENLFNPYAPLNTIKKFFIRINEKEFIEVSNLLKNLLGLDNRYEFIRKNKDIYLKNNNETEISLKDLSDGFQSMIALASDIIIILKQYWSKIEEAEGIVLIDEIDLHLHPQWKMKVVTHLRESFPRVQFISTTHDPLCLRGLESNEINVVKKTNEEVYLVNDLPNIEGMQIDQILMANYFGLHSTYSTYYNDLFNRYYTLLNKSDKTLEEKEEISDISKTINKATVLGNTKREQILFSVIDSYIAQGTDKLINSNIEPKLKNKLLNILDSTEGDDHYD
ncbi:AAA family ATPase [Peribacillus simplex]|uniref:AAA family ATPase n=1 Tax=Peribacillus simplex TaxID=1478 RepID=UPI0025A30644|nr:AAA family ATPase [Peribacillus simplex]MDM5291703.1 AAA family ATPase [Peribacillus simplex]